MFRREAPGLVAQADETGRETLRHEVRSRETEFLDGNELVSIQKLGPPGFARGSWWLVFRRGAPRPGAKVDETGRETLRQAE